MAEIGLSRADQNLIYDLAHKLTGTAEDQSMQHEIFLTNVMRRIQQVGKQDLMSYLDYVAVSEIELAYFISAVTIHTTGWFRELPHYKSLEKALLSHQAKLKGMKVRLLSAACSTGEEIYSFGMILENIRRAYEGFEYELIGFDVDPICVQRAETGYYQGVDILSIPTVYQNFLIRAKNSENNYAIESDIRRRTFFQVGNLLDPDSFLNDPFDFVYCRNVLIYFSREKINHIIGNLLSVVKIDGALTLGHSESIDPKMFNLVSVGESTYHRMEDTKVVTFREKPITVLSIDNTRTRLWLATVLAEHGIKVITAENSEAANEILTRNKIDLITIDLNLPGQNGLHWISSLRREGFRAPVILLTETSTEQITDVLEALSCGSQDYFDKRMLEIYPDDFIERIRNLVKAARHKGDDEQKPVSFTEFRGRISEKLFRPEAILVGASTGGTEALAQLLHEFPKNSPPIICVQHIPHEFATVFLERLCKVSGLSPGPMAATSDTLLKPGHVYLSVIDAHLGLRNSGDKLSIYYSHCDKITGHRPSVDYLFQTASFLRNRKIVGCLLTGMGRDGAQGLLELKRNGALTLAQNQDSSVVWGMPGEAVKLGAPVVVGTVRELRDLLLHLNSLPEATGKASVPVAS